MQNTNLTCMNEHLKSWSFGAIVSMCQKPSTKIFMFRDYISKKKHFYYGPKTKRIKVDLMLYVYTVPVHYKALHEQRWKLSIIAQQHVKLRIISEEELWYSAARAKCKDAFILINMWYSRMDLQLMYFSITLIFMAECQEQQESAIISFLKQQVC